jgi:hypothetical protein
MVEEVAEVSAAVVAQKLRSGSAVGIQLVLPHVPAHMQPEAREAASRIKFLIRRKQDGTAPGAYIKAFLLQVWLP